MGDPQPQASPARRPWAWTGAAGLLAAVLALALWHWLRPPASVDEEIWASRSIAVLPFTAAGEGQPAWFAEAVTEEVIAGLARLASTRVIAHASASAIAARAADAQATGRELGVRYVLSGQVRRSGESVHVLARFTSARDGTVLWTEQLRYAEAKHWQWPRDIALRIARTLDLRPAEAAVPPRRPVRLLRVADAVMQAQSLLRHAAGPAEMRRARAAFEAALVQEPDSLAALAGLALAHLQEVQGRFSENPKAQTAAAALAIERALAIDPDHPAVNNARGHLLWIRGDEQGSLDAFRRVIAANPSDAWAHVRATLGLLALGRLEEVVPAIALAERLSPYDKAQAGFAHYLAGMAQFHLGDVEGARRRFRQSVEATPAMLPSWAWLAAIDALQDRQDDARRSIEEMLRLRPQLSIRSLQAHLSSRTTHARLAPGLQRLREGLLKAGLPPE